MTFEMSHGEQSIRIRNGSGDELFVQIVPSTLEIDNHIIRP
jgi:hypothetical protein